jgi:hypothetical protein
MADDWKRTLFVWRGVLSNMESSNTLSWKGTWVATEDAVSRFPAEKDFQDSENRFELIGKDQDENGAVAAELSDTRFRTAPRVMAFSGFYYLNNSDGPSKHVDERHYIGFFQLNDEKNDDEEEEVDGRGEGKEAEGVLARHTLCAAKGHNEYGRFISKGVITISTNTDANATATATAATVVSATEQKETTTTLTLVRRYLPSGDARQTNWSKQQLANIILETTSVGGDNVNDVLALDLRLRLHPWENLPFEVVAAAKRKKDNKGSDKRVGRATKKRSLGS